MNENENREAFEIDVIKLLLAFLNKWWLFIIFVVIGGAIAFLYTSTYITPMYRANVTIYVNSMKQGVVVDSVNGSNLTTSQKLVNTYINFIKSDTVLEKVIESAELDLNAAQLRKFMSASQVGETELFNVYVENPSPERAAYIANAIADVAPAEIENFVEGSSTKIIDYAKVPTARFSPSYAKNTIIGAAIGFVLVAAYVAIGVILDVRIKDEKDLAALSDFPILGQIPDFNQLSVHSGYYGHKGNKYAYEASKKKEGQKE